MRLQLISLLLLPFLPVFSSQLEQIPMAGTVEPEYTPQTNLKPTLADLLTIESSASIFFSYARELEMSKMFADTSAKITLLVPTNKAVMALARKPHQGPTPIEDDIEISEQELDNRSRKNVERWVSAHIIPESPIALEAHTYRTLLEEKIVTFETLKGGDAEAPEWARVTLENGARITNMKEGSNGVLYIIDGTITVD